MVAIDSLSWWFSGEIKCQCQIDGAFDVTEEALELLDVFRARVGHKLTKFGNGERQIHPGPNSGGGVPDLEKCGPYGPRRKSSFWGCISKTRLLL